VARRVTSTSSGGGCNAEAVNGGGRATSGGGGSYEQPGKFSLLSAHFAISFFSNLQESYASLYYKEKGIDPLHEHHHLTLGQAMRT
jgi:hypothetical protein